MPENMDLPYIVTTNDATKITASGATLAGGVSIIDSKEIECGVIYGTTSSLSAISGTKKFILYISSGDFSSHDFSINISGLKANTTYYYRAYAVDADVYKYGEVRSFKTLQPNISVTTGSTENITYSSATLSGTVNGADQSLTCGIIYSTSSSLSSTSGTKKSTTSSGNFSLSVTSLYANTTYYYCAYVVVDGKYRCGDVRSFKTLQGGSPNTSSHEAVDLGLSVKWASCNVGSESPEDYGGYYAWGETEEKSNYDWSTYKWCNGSYDTQTKYCTNSSYGTVDNKTTLDLEDDVAHIQWGGNWRMPTKAEQDELRTECSWSWTSVNGVNGYQVTGPNGNSIFLPAAGYRYGTGVLNRGSYGDYWSGTLYERSSDNACSLYFYSGLHDWYYSSRYYGRTVRPVTD